MLILSTSPFLSSRARLFLLRLVINARSYCRFLGFRCTSRTHLILTVIYFASTGMCNVVRDHSVQDASKRAAKLSLINLFTPNPLSFRKYYYISDMLQ
jgi:hypothetical protein